MKKYIKFCLVKTKLLIFLTLLSCSNVDVVEDSVKVVASKARVEDISQKLLSDIEHDEDVNSTDPEILPVDQGIIKGSARIDDALGHKRKTYFLYGAEHLNLDNYYFDIPVVYNKAVKKWIHYFVTRGRGHFKRASVRAGRYAPLLGSILEDHGLPRDLIFLAMAESGFQNKARSWAKAVGPWQFVAFTGRKYGLNIDWYIDERRDPIKATIAACKYLTTLYELFGAWELAFAAYNAGEGKIGRAIRRYKTENFWQIRKGRYLKSETKNYVPKIMALAIIGKNLKAFGFEDIDFHSQLNFVEIDVPPLTDLMLLSKGIGVEFSTVQYLNPELLRWYTSPYIKNYKLRIPLEAEMSAADINLKEDFSATSFRDYKVRGRRSNLKKVARKFKIKPYVLEDINNFERNDVLKRGTRVLLPFRKGQSTRAAMYKDLYERPRKSVLRRRKYRRLIRIAQRKGKKITSPSQYYTVKNGDSLWEVARKTGVSLNTLIVSNLNILKKRMIRKGDRLVVR